MLFDNTLLLADEQVVTEDAAGAIGSSAAVIEAGGDDYSTMWVATVVKTALAGTGSVDVILQTSDDETFTSPTSLHTMTLSAANGTKGAVLAYRLPLGLKKYTRVYFDVTGTVSAGKVTVGLTDGIWAK